MSLKINPLYLTDGYKASHKAMLAPGTTRLYGTWIPRSTKHAPKRVTKIVSFGQQMTWRYINDAFQEHFFDKNWEEVQGFVSDMNQYLGLAYDGSHFRELHQLGYLPIKVKSLPEGIETNPNIPHMTFVNTVDGFAWLTLYLETLVSSLAWKPSTSATIALQYRRKAAAWVKKTDPNQSFLIPFLCHDFSARGLNPHDMIGSGLGHATSFRGSDTLSVIPAARYYYGETGVCINSVNASEHSVSTTKIFTVGERQMIIDWLKLMPDGIFSQVADTFSLWKFIEYLSDPEIKTLVLGRNGKLVVRPDSGDPVDIICGLNTTSNDIDPSSYNVNGWEELSNSPQYKGVIELLWDIFGGTINEQGYKVLDPHIGAIYGDSINLERQVQIYERLAAKGFAATNIVLGVGSFTYQFNTRDTFGFAAKGAWFEVLQKVEGGFQRIVKDENGIPVDFEYEVEAIGYNIYKDPVTDDGTKKSLKGLQMVYKDNNGEYQVKGECSWEEESSGELQLIYEDGEFYNQTTLTEVRKRIDSIV